MHTNTHICDRVDLDDSLRLNVQNFKMHKNSTRTNYAAEKKGDLLFIDLSDIGPRVGLDNGGGSG